MAAAGEPRQPAASLPLRFLNQNLTKGAEETPNRNYTPVASRDRLTAVHRGLGAPPGGGLSMDRWWGSSVMLRVQWGLIVVVMGLKVSTGDDSGQ
ncbi:hypothetical protein V6N13_126683 [Hibiscus sabdariffa]